MDKKILVSNITSAMREIDGPKRAEIINRQLYHFFRADISLGMAIVQTPGINAEEIMPVSQTKKESEPA